MYLFIDIDNNKKLSENEVYFAFFNYMKNLLGEYWKHNVKVEVTFSNVYSAPRIGGYILDDEDDFDYRIWVRKSASRSNQLITLAHECVHLKQLINGELCLTELRRAAEPYDDSAYWDDPREIEAFGREMGLYFRYIKSFGI